MSRTSGPSPAQISTVAMAAVLAAGAGAQSYEDFRLFRDRPSPWPSFLQARIGAAAVVPDDEDPDLGRDTDVAPRGFVWYRNDRFTNRDAQLDVYAGVDGAVLTVREADPGEFGSRLELFGRYFQFQRDGFFRSDDFVPTGRYEAFDYGAYLGVGRYVDEGLALEAGPFYRRATFDRSDDTDPAYTLPDDFHAFGMRAFLEHDTLQLARDTGLPQQGFLFVVRGEYERNTSDREFGSPVFRTRLPSGFYRARAALEWYFPSGESSVWDLRIDGQWTDDEDRIHNTEAHKPPGPIWADARFGWRLDLGRSWFVRPYVHGQFTRTVGEFGTGHDEDFWFGGGLETRLMFTDAIGLHAEYSYLNNPYRPSISPTEDTYGEHQFFVGVELRFGSR